MTIAYLIDFDIMIEFKFEFEIKFQSFTILCFMLNRTLPHKVTHFRQALVNELRLYMVFTLMKALHDNYWESLNPEPDTNSLGLVVIDESDSED